jgi:membrane protein YdbS with pleckstrin-like domain
MEKNNMSISLVVFIVFLTLKLSNVVDWSWWLVTLPLWWWLPTIIIVISIAVIYVLITERFKDRED